jgi:hypothetical protein
MIKSVKYEIENAIGTLGLSEKDITILDRSRAEKVVKECSEHFSSVPNALWWWEHFREPYCIISDSNSAYLLLDEIIPEGTDHVWFFVQDHEAPYFIVCDTNPFVIKDIIGQCYGFEYYIIPKSKSWLICENHHNTIIGVGSMVCAKYARSSKGSI